MGYNKLSSSIPTQLGRVSAFKQGMYLYKNSLTSTIPTELGNLGQMEVLVGFDDNQLTSTVPTELGKLVKMMIGFSFSRNLLSSTIPTELGKLEEMRLGFDGRHASLSSALPTQLGKLHQLVSYFDLSDNSLSSAIPTQLGQLDQVTAYFDISGNSLSSAIPTEFGQVILMSSGFDVSDNSLSSAIPTELGQLEQISSYFDLGDNSLTLRIPTELGKLTKMSNYFALQSNWLSSTLPTELGKLDQMSSGFYLQSNLLCSDLPTELGTLSDFDWEVTGNSIGSPCPQKRSEPARSSKAAAPWWAVVGGAVLALVALGLVGYACVTRARALTKRQAADGVEADDDATVIITTTRVPLLSDVEVHRALNGHIEPPRGFNLEEQEGEVQLQLLHNDESLTNAWQNSDMQLVVLDHELRMVLWSKGMAKAMSGYVPAEGAIMKGLPFPSATAQQKFFVALYVIMREGSRETALHPVLALQAAVTSAPNVSLHLVTPLTVGVHRDVLLSMTAIKMLPLSTTRRAAAPGEAGSESPGLDSTPCQLLIMGHESFDPGLASLCGISNEKATVSSLSDLTSDSGYAVGSSMRRSWERDGTGSASGTGSGTGSSTGSGSGTRSGSGAGSGSTSERRSRSTGTSESGSGSRSSSGLHRSRGRGNLGESSRSSNDQSRSDASRGSGKSRGKLGSSWMWETEGYGSESASDGCGSPLAFG